MRNGNGVARIESKKTNGSTVRRTVRVKIVLRRLRRVLLPKGLTIMQSRPVFVRGKRGYPDDVGRFFVVRGESEIVEHHVDLDQFARKHGVVKSWEEVEEHRNSPPSNGDGGRVQKRA